MKLAVFSPVFGNKTLEEALRYLSSKGVDGMELGAGGYPGKAHADILELKKDAGERAALLLDREEIDNRFIWHDAIKVIPVYIIVVYVIALGCSYILP